MKLRTHSTFRRFLCFRKVFSECQVCAHTEPEMFYFYFLFFVVLLFKSFNRTWRCTHASTHARTLPCTHGRTHTYFIALITWEGNCFYIALSGYPTFGTIFLGCRGFHIKLNIPLLQDVWEPCDMVLLIFNF